VRLGEGRILPIRAVSAAAGPFLCAVPLGLRADRHYAGRGTAPTSAIQINGRAVSRGAALLLYALRRSTHLASKTLSG
jgi:hypothetical protein